MLRRAARLAASTIGRAPATRPFPACAASVALRSQSTSAASTSGKGKGKGKRPAGADAPIPPTTPNTNSTAAAIKATEEALAEAAEEVELDAEALGSEVEGVELTIENDPYGAGRVALTRKQHSLGDAIEWWHQAEKQLPTEEYDQVALALAFLKTDIWRPQEVQRVVELSGLPDKLHAQYRVWKRAAENAFRYREGAAASAEEVKDAFAVVHKAVDGYVEYANAKSARKGQGPLHPPMALLMLLGNHPIIPDRFSKMDRLLARYSKHSDLPASLPRRDDRLTRAELAVYRSKSFKEAVDVLANWNKSGNLRHRRKQIYAGRVVNLAFDKDLIMPVETWADFDKRFLKRGQWFMYPQLLKAAIYGLRRPLHPLYRAVYAPKNDKTYEADVRAKIGAWTREFEDRYLNEKVVDQVVTPERLAEMTEQALSGDKSVNFFYNNPKPEAYMRLVTLYRMAGQEKDAARVLQVMRSRFPDNWWPNAFLSPEELAARRAAAAAAAV